jgi:hypothetical protein
MLIEGKPIDMRRGDLIAAFCEVILETQPPDEKGETLNRVDVDKIKKKILSESRDIAIEVTNMDIVPKGTIDKIANITASLRLTGYLTSIIRDMMETVEGRGMMMNLTSAAAAIKKREDSR